MFLISSCITFVFVVIVTALFYFGFRILRLGYQQQSLLRFVGGVFCCGLSVLIIGMTITFLIQFNWSISERKNPRDYSRTLTELHPQGYHLEHFPATIPADAKNVHFFYHPHFGQGAMLIQLRYQTTSALLDVLYQRYISQPHRVIHGDEEDTVHDDLLARSFWTSDSSSQSRGTGAGKAVCVNYPADYDIIILAPLDVSDHGVAISKLRHEIVYWSHG